MSGAKPSIWFKICTIPAMVLMGGFLFSFLALITWGMIVIPLVALIYGTPWVAAHYLSWGRQCERAEHAEIIALVPVTPTNYPEGWARSLIRWVLIYVVMFAVMLAWVASLLP